MFLPVSPEGTHPLTKRDYLAIAEALNARRFCLAPEDRPIVDLVAITLANVFKSENPGFDRYRFIDAVKYGVSVNNYPKKAQALK